MEKTFFAYIGVDFGFLKINLSQKLKTSFVL
jgi:hypothetical protein